MKHPKKKYLVLPGRVRSINDGQVHYIGAVALMRLYNVNPEECVVVTEGQRVNPEWKKLIKLRPSPRGMYTDYGKRKKRKV